MSAFTPPRADLRGGNQSADSLTSRRIFASSCSFARTFQAVRGVTPRKVSNPLTSALIQITLRCSGFRPIARLAKHVFASFRSVDVVARGGLSPVTLQCESHEVRGL